MYVYMLIWLHKQNHQIIIHAASTLSSISYFAFPPSPPSSPVLITSLPSHGNSLGGILSHFSHVHMVTYIYTHTYTHTYTYILTHTPFHKNGATLYKLSCILFSLLSNNSWNCLQIKWPRYNSFFLMAKKISDSM